MRQLSLRPHPEGGWYSEVFRSRDRVTASGRRGERAALTSIYVLLVSGQTCRWHRVLSDEAWHFYEGAPLDLFTVDASFERMEHTSLGLHSSGTGSDRPVTRPTHVVPAGAWQAVRPTGDYALAGCTVGPGFDAADFSLLSDDTESAARLVARFPHLADLV